jgi:hypothetical protein
MRLVVRYLSGSPEVVTPHKNSVMVSRDRFGLPTVIPGPLRILLRDFRANRKMVVCILSLLSIYRVFPTHVKPSLETIISPHTGLTKTLNLSQIKLALRELKLYRLKLRQPELIKLESAGPNARKSAWSSSLDAIAFYRHPDTLIGLLRYLSAQKANRYSV